jgi:hypothetical protein
LGGYWIVIATVLASVSAKVEMEVSEVREGTGY